MMAKTSPMFQKLKARGERRKRRKRAKYSKKMIPVEAATAERVVTTRKRKRRKADTRTSHLPRATASIGNFNSGVKITDHHLISEQFTDYFFLLNTVKPSFKTRAQVIYWLLMADFHCLKSVITTMFFIIFRLFAGGLLLPFHPFPRTLLLPCSPFLQASLIDLLCSCCLSSTHSSLGLNGGTFVISMWIAEAIGTTDDRPGGDHFCVQMITDLAREMLISQSSSFTSLKSSSLLWHDWCTTNESRRGNGRQLQCW